MTTPTFRKLLSGVISGLSLGTRLPNLKFVALAVLELLAFNAQKSSSCRFPGVTLNNALDYRAISDP